MHYIIPYSVKIFFFLAIICNDILPNKLIVEFDWHKNISCQQTLYPNCVYMCILLFDIGNTLERSKLKAATSCSRFSLLDAVRWENENQPSSRIAIELCISVWNCLNFVCFHSCLIDLGWSWILNFQLGPCKQMINP